MEPGGTGFLTHSLHHPLLPFLAARTFSIANPKGQGSRYDNVWTLEPNVNQIPGCETVEPKARRLGCSREVAFSRWF